MKNLMEGLIVIVLILAVGYLCNKQLDIEHVERKARIEASKGN
jgi:hypothetical protein